MQSYGQNQETGVSMERTELFICKMGTKMLPEKPRNMRYLITSNQKQVHCSYVDAMFLTDPREHLFDGEPRFHSHFARWTIREVYTAVFGWFVFIWHKCRQSWGFRLERKQKGQCPMGKLGLDINFQSLHRSNQAKDHTFYHALEILPNTMNIR